MRNRGRETGRVSETEGGRGAAPLVANPLDPPCAVEQRVHQGGGGRNRGRGGHGALAARAAAAGLLDIGVRHHLERRMRGELEKI